MKCIADRGLVDIKAIAASIWEIFCRQQEINGQSQPGAFWRSNFCHSWWYLEHNQDRAFKNYVFQKYEELWALFGFGGFYFFTFQIIHLVFVLVPFDHFSFEMRLKSPVPPAVLGLALLFFENIFLALFLRFSTAIKMSRRPVAKFCRQFWTFQTNQWETGRELGNLLHTELPVLILPGVSTHIGDEPLGWSSTVALGHHGAPFWIATRR